MSFRYVPDSVNLYCVSTIIFFRPWVDLKVVFGNQVCYSGYLYFYETYKKINIEDKNIKKIEFINQNPLGKSSRSNPVTYTKIYDDIRKVFHKQDYNHIKKIQLKL